MDGLLIDCNGVMVLFVWMYLYGCGYESGFSFCGFFDFGVVG